MLTSIFLILSFLLEQQARIRACVVYVVPIAFASTFLLLDVIAVRWHLHRASRQRRRDQHQHFDLHWNDNWIHGEEYHPWPSMIWVVIDNPLVLFPTHVWSCLGYTLDSLLFLQLFLEYFLWSSTPTPTCNTMLILPRSMTEVFRISTRTLEAHCRMFLDLLSKHRCMGNIMILPLPQIGRASCRERV